MVSAKRKHRSASSSRRATIQENQNESATLGPEPGMESPVSDVLPPDIIRSEVNFLALPFFALSRRDTHGRMKTEYHATVQRGGDRVEVSWKVLAHQEYGYPGPFDREVHKAVEHLVSEMRPPLENPILLGSLYNIAKLMGLQFSGRASQDIKKAIQRIKVTVHWNPKEPSTRKAVPGGPQTHLTYTIVWCFSGRLCLTGPPLIPITFS